MREPPKKQKPKKKEIKKKEMSEHELRYLGMSQEGLTSWWMTALIKKRIN